VELQLNSNLDTVTQISVGQSYVYTLVSVDTVNRKLVATNSSGVNVTVSLESTTSILNKDSQTVTLSGLSVGNPIVLTYTGTKLITVQEPAVVRGRITSIDTAGGKLNVTDSVGVVKEFSLGGGITVRSGNLVSTNATSLKVNDRVQVVKDGFGIPYVAVASGSERTFSSYKASTNEITFKRVQLSDQAVYPVHTTAYVHTAQGTSLSLTQLKDSDKVTIYVLDGKIIELIK
jgi:hypothetical protein